MDRWSSLGTSMVIQPNRGNPMRDTGKEYRDGYPHQIATASENLYYYFYKNVYNPPNLGFRDQVYAWNANDDVLESEHQYIQWLFPNRESSQFNPYAKPLQFEELQLMRQDQEIQSWMIQFYRMMLHFYGFSLIDEQSGQLDLDADRYEQRFEHLSTSRHNWYRITRILKCLGDMGYERFKNKWLWLIMMQMIQHDRLTALAKPMIDYWLPTLRNRAYRQRYTRIMLHHLGEYEWNPKIDKFVEDDDGDHSVDNVDPGYFSNIPESIV